MKVSESWLREHVRLDLTTEALVAKLTMAGLEVDGVEHLAPAFSGVVVGEIRAVHPHPDAAQLRLCEVATDARPPVQVVCGAANARAGLRVAFAPVGATLGERAIGLATLRGQESAGMLCSALELGISDAGEGLLELPADAPLGGSLSEFLRLDDQIIEIDLTPNRGDCLSVRGLAREIGAIIGSATGSATGSAVSPVADPVAAMSGATLAVEVSAPQACPRYCGRVVRNIDASRPTPLWLQVRLRRAGIRSINAVVDVTNYVMLELGQPLHAFDLDRLAGGIQVRCARAGERLVTLDGNDVELKADTLVIADQQQPLAMAGIIGGAASGVVAATRHLFIESAHFAPLAVAGRARAYGLHTESSHRFERGVDPALARIAIERATALLLALVGGEPGPVVCTEDLSAVPGLRAIRLRRQRLRQQLALELADDLVEDILGRLGVEIIARDGAGWSCLAPSWRFDLRIEVDLIEELARVYGYDRLPTATLALPLDITPASERQTPVAEVRRVLTARGYQEAITYSFVDPELQRRLDPDQVPTPVLNPISSDLAVMRTSLWPGLLAALQHNLNRQQTRIRLFETGLRFVVRAGELMQEPMVAGLISGPRHAESWAAPRQPVDFYDIKGDVEALCGLARVTGPVRFAPAARSGLHPGQTAEVIVGESPSMGSKSIGSVGKLHPSIGLELGLAQDVFLFELSLAGLLCGTLPQFAELSRFPAVRRDLAVVVDQATPVEDLSRVVRASAGETLSELIIFDVYDGKGIENKKKSIGLGLTFQHRSRTLGDAEIGASLGAVTRALRTQLAADLRDGDFEARQV